MEKIIMESLNELNLGLSFNYVPSWGNWEVIRELTSNARDTDTKFSVKKENGNLIIHDEGQGLLIKHLLIGESGSRENGEKIGQFGEGLKNAILVLTRNGKTVEILSQDKRIVNGIKEIEGVKTLSFIWENVEYHNGTTITIYEWDDQNDYQNKFLFSREDVEDITIITNTSGSILDDQILYNQGVFVQELENYSFGYNINNKSMNNRDRNVISESELQNCIGNIWMQVDDKYGWQQFFEAIKEKKFENTIRISKYYMDDNVISAAITGFEMVFGRNCVIKTSNEAARESEHCGANPLDIRIFGYNIQSFLSGQLKTDVEYVNEKKGKKAFNVPLSHLNPEQKKILSAIKKICKKVEFNGEIIIAEIPDFPAYYDSGNNVIKIRPSVLNDLFYAQETIIHELGHWITNGASDLSERHVAGCCQIGRMLMK
jgi:hypothetical protein